MEDGNLISQVFLPISLAFIMFTVGIELTVADFRRIAVQPRAFAVGVVSQVVVLPLVALGLILLFDVNAVLAVGVMIIAACPGGVTSNLMTYLVRADTALSVSLTALVSLLSVVTIPVIVGGAVVFFIEAEEAPDLSVARTVVGIFLITTVPVILGMAVNRFFPVFARKFDRIGRVAATVLFIAIIAGAIFSGRENIVTYFVQVGGVLVALNIVMLALAALLSRTAGLGRDQRVANTLECGLQNGTLGIFVALSLLGSEEMMIPSAVYSLIMFPSAIAYMVWARRTR
ncbi:MAG: bile acid:sodium symporter family protein [Alphaproteobacteria bacterium]|nr:bile acid:sodium symporter family protein [Alphaproteobacteria bacterium]